jgi:hypothetical protein
VKDDRVYLQHIQDALNDIVRIAAATAKDSSTITH